MADHPLEGPLHVIWAYGHGQYSDGDSFYREDQLKYHGGNEGGDNRKHRSGGCSQSGWMTHTRRRARVKLLL